MPLIRDKAASHPALLLANHGPIVAGASLEGAIFAIEELEETARLVLLTSGMRVRHLDSGQVSDLNAAFKLK